VKKPLIFLLGRSGAGISTCLRALQDLGYFVVDNLPVHLVHHVVQEMERDASEAGHDDKKPYHRITGYCFGIHTHHPCELSFFQDIIHKTSEDYDVEVVFLTAHKDVLEQRFSVTRRPHPWMAKVLSLKECIAYEVHALKPLESLAHHVIDTSPLTPQALGHLMVSRYGSAKSHMPLLVMFSSFGFKNTAMIPGDLVFDVRFLKNPYFESSLRQCSGLQEKVQDYVKSDPGYHKYVDHLEEFIARSLPYYCSEGRTYLRIAVGCTGGIHRSVTVVEDLSQRLASSKSAGDISVHKYHHSLNVVSMMVSGKKD